VATDIVEAVFVAAAPAEVFEYFVKPELFETWMGERAMLDATAGGVFAVDIDGTAVRGHFVEVDPPRRLVVTWGFAGSADLPPGASTLEVTFVADGDGTLVRVVHRMLPAAQSDPHARGWRRFLGHLASRARS
jgi:uncharacterized protein YndB with AHSA1/START domain